MERVFFSKHKLSIITFDIKKLKEILDQHNDLVVTGIANGNQTEYFKLFDKVFLLQCSPKTLVHRMQTRETLWGKTKVESDYTLKWQKAFDDECISIGVIPISTEGKIEIVMDKIVDKI